jgi:hypothetical protein
MARASTPTILSLNRYSEIMGITPMHFHGATADDYFPLRNTCNDLWVQHSWQFADVVGREDVAREIAQAEIAIANELGWWPAPKWIVQEVHRYLRHYRRDAYRRYGRNVRGQRVGIQTDYGKIISPGQRATSAVKTGATVAYTDEDGDGFYETATVTAATTLTNVNEVYAFTAGKSGAVTWEIVPARTKAISGGTLTMTFWSWQMIDPDLWEIFPTPASLDGQITINLNELTGEGPYTKVVSTVDIYRVYTDTTIKAAQMIWEPLPAGTSLLGEDFCLSATDCGGVELTEQDGFFNIRDPELGRVVPIPATYDEDDAKWSQVCFTKAREPDMVKLWYYCGDQSQDHLSGRVSDPLSQKWAYTIAQLATARLERPLCGCGNTTALATKWQLDAAEESSGLNISFEELGNPFGTRYGEILAWRTVRRERQKITGGGAV